MLTDWTLIRRAAHELGVRLRGGRVRDAGLLPDGRLGVLLRTRGRDVTLAVDVFGAPPLVMLIEAELGIAPEPGFVRALADGLRGMTFLAADAAWGERALRATFGTRSRFGVGDELELHLELVPRFGNAILTKAGIVVSAAREFSLAQNGTRAIEAGRVYQPPPARPGSLLPAALRACGADEAAFLHAIEGPAATNEPLYVVRDGAVLQAAYVTEPPHGDAARATREASVLDLFAESYEANARARGQDRVAIRRGQARKRLDARAQKLESELRAIQGRRVRAAAREALREEGAGIYATLHEVPNEEREARKERAVAAFAEYRKLGAALPHLTRREADVRAVLANVEALVWELERVDDDRVADVEAAMAHLEGASRRHAPAPASKRRKPLEVRTQDGGRILIGRSPIENADLTFRVARPNDLWFHVQGAPGAHVILARDDGAEAEAADIARAAAFAAFYSKARASAKVSVDYTRRKHVRKQQNAPPGRVWYTHATSILVEPRAPHPDESS